MLHTGLAANGVDTSKDVSSVTPLGSYQSSGAHRMDPGDLVELM